MKILITGGAGFIGSNFLKYMLLKYPKYKFVNLDALTYAGHLETLEDIKDNPHYKFVKGDISDKNTVENLFENEKFDIVVNFAAESHVDRSVIDPEIFIRTNVMGTQVLLEACRKYDIKKFHQVSTDEVYGDLPLDRKDLFFCEDTCINPSSPYSTSKASADLLALAYYRTFKLPVTVSRCSNNYGPYQLPEKFIPVIMIKSNNNNNIPVYGNGLNIRDWLHVYDHCEAIDLIIHNGRIGEVYNIGGHNEKTNLEVVKNIISILNKPESLIKFAKDRPGHDLRYAIDASKIEKELGWNPKYNFEIGIKQTIRWYLDNEKWLRAVMKYSTL